MLQPSLPLAYYTVEPHSAEGKIRNRLTSCKSFSGRASELVTDLQAIVDPSIAKPSKIIRTAAVDEEEVDSEDQAEDGDGEDEIFDQREPSDHSSEDDSWESGSIHSENDSPSAGQYTKLSDSESELQSSSALGAHPPAPSDLKVKSQAKMKPEVAFEGDDEEYTFDSDSDSDVSLHDQTKASMRSAGAGTSTFLPSLSVGYIPGTGDSDPEDELEVVEGKGERKNRRGQRARRA